MAIKRHVRLTQTVVPFGVGAIYDFLGESFVGCDTHHWSGNGQSLHAPRLAEALDVAGFRSPPTQAPYGNRAPGIPYFRFPQWLFCQRCRSMTLWSTSREVEGEVARCQACPQRPKLVPMRFVMVCRNGHLADVPWHRWAHFGATKPDQRQCQSKNLMFKTRRSVGSGLKSLFVECRTCQASRSLNGISGSGSMRPLGVKCPGKQPWQRFDPARQCEEEPQVLQRGASNVYFALVRSAIDIPPHSSYATYSDLTLRITNSPHWPTLRSIPQNDFRDYLVGMVATEVGCTADRVRIALEQEERAIAGAGPAPAPHADDLETEEWRAFLTPWEEQDHRDNFITRHVPLVPESNRDAQPHAILELDALVDNVVLATRLREIRALVGFSRYEPDAPIVAPGLEHNVPWLPAIEVFGEGIFLSLKEEAVRVWESRPDVIAAASELEVRRRGSLLGARLKPGTPRFVLLHTLAHALIRQLAFQCGYSASSLRERIYAKTAEEGEPQIGILIYTAAGDVEGTLGGLVRQGESPHLAHTILSALERAEGCSLDPICREAKSQGFEGLNRAACHACSLVSETSCDNANALLDRGFLIGSESVTGFFGKAIKAAVDESAAMEAAL